MSQKLRSHVLCYPFPALVSFGGVFRLVGIFGGYNAMDINTSTLRETKKKKREQDRLVIKIIFRHELAEFCQPRICVYVFFYGVLMGLLAFEG